MSIRSVSTPPFLTRRKTRKRTQKTSDNSSCDVPLLNLSGGNTVSFPSISSDQISPRSHPTSSPSLRKIALLSHYMGYACSKDSLPEIDESTVKRDSQIASSYVNEQEIPDIGLTPPSQTKLSRHYSKIKKTINLTSFQNSQIQGPSSRVVKNEGLAAPYPSLTFPLSLQEDLNIGLGWPDELGVRSETRELPHRPWLTNGGTFSDSSQRTTWSQPSRPASRQSMRDKPWSRDFLNAQDESLALKTPLTVLETGQSHSETFTSTEWAMSSVIFAETNPLALSRDVSQNKSREHLQESRPPQVNLQVRASDDWAAAIFKVIDETNGG